MLQYPDKELGASLQVRGYSTRRRTSFSISWIHCSTLSSRYRGVMLFLILIGRRATISTLCVGAIGWSLEYRLPIVIYPGHSFLSPAIFEIYIRSDIMIMRTSVSLPLSVDLMSVIKSLYSAISLYISQMYFSHWEPPGVSERRRSVNLEASISGENQTLGGHSGRPSEELGSLLTGTGAPWERL